MKHLVYRVVAMFAILFSVNTVSAQTSSGEISGRVVDSSGAAIANAAITLTNQLTGQQLATTTDKFGGFVFTALQPSTFSVSVRANGFLFSPTLKLTRAPSTSRFRFPAPRLGRPWGTTGEAIPLSKSRRPTFHCPRVLRTTLKVG